MLNAQLISAPSFNWDSSPMLAMQSMIVQLRKLRSQQGAQSAAWKSSCNDLAQEVQRRLSGCPFTMRARNKPRGYAGDAIMIDHIYGTTTEEAPPTDTHSTNIYKFAIASPAPRAVRYRRYRLALLIDQVAQQLARPISVLSVAAGHARELDLSTAYTSGMVQRMVTLDQDPQSIEVIRRNHGSKVQCVQASIRGLLTGKQDLGQFDVIYSAGLYDYLSQDTATRLTSQMFSMLNPGGSLLYANFAPDIEDVGYMEAAMDWWLTYRDSEETWQLSQGIDPQAMGKVDRFTDPDENIHFVRLRKRIV
jgi:extracellular factor (EF) 3-hydroxypalmitic acid methyl ester biosynthesis protein